MLVDGKGIAQAILAETATEIAKFNLKPKMAVITCDPNFETKKYLAMKADKARVIGIDLNLIELPKTAETEQVVLNIKEVMKDADGVVVQLPLPVQIDTETVLKSVTVDKDPDGFLYCLNDTACLPPVVGAIDEISQRYQVDWFNKKVVILGAGRLVGKPSAIYAEKRGAKVSILTKDNYDVAKLLIADIIVSGIGQHQFIKPHMVKDGVVIFDAGTSEDGGVLVGDVATAVASKATLLTPVPGGIGPITIAYLLRNLVKLTRQ